MISWVFDILPMQMNQLHFIVRFILYPLFFFLPIYALIKLRNRLAFIYFLGNMSLNIGSLFAFYVMMTDYGSPALQLFVLPITTIIECIFFGLGLGYKTKLAYDSRDSAQQALLKETIEKKELQQNYNSELQREVKRQAAVLSDQNKELLSTKFQNQILELEADRLQQQMNPHFLFNCLSSIKYFSLTKGPQETADYITLFSRLMRIILQNSRKTLISISDEISFLELYLNVEQKRFDQAFEYEIQLDDKIKIKNSFIPPMLLQPFVENSIVHGILPKKAGIGKIEISFNQSTQYLHISIKDNGIGRTQSLKRNARKHKNKNQTSLATKITRDRLNKMNMIYEDQSDIDIIDLIKDQAPTGTLVNIRLPSNLQDQHSYEDDLMSISPNY